MQDRPPLSVDDPARPDAALGAEQLRLYMANGFVVSLGALLVLALVLSVLHAAVDSRVLAAWAMALVGMMALRYRLSRRAGDLPADADPAPHLRRLRWAVAMNGALWGLAGWLLFPAQDLLLQLFLAFVLAGMAAGTMTLTAFDPVAARSFAVLAVLPLCLRMVLTGQSTHLAMSAMVLLFTLFLGMSGARAFQTLRSAVALRRADLLRAETLERSRQHLQQVADQLASKTDALEITLDSMDQAILSLGPDGRLNFFNRRLVELLELPESLLATRPTMEEIARFQADQGHFGPSNQLMGDTARPYLERWLAGERPPFPPHYYRRTVSGRMLEVKTRYLDRQRMVRTFSDVTDHFDAQQRLVQSEAQARKLALVAAHTDDIVIISDRQGRIEWINDAFTRANGYTLAEASGCKPSELLRGPETDAAAAARFDIELAQQGRATAELINRAKDGRCYWMALEAHAITDEDGGTRQYVSIARDITDRRHAEAAVLSARLEAERANRAKSDFLSAMSHELRTPLNAILGFAQLIAVDGSQQLDERNLGYVHEIQRAGQHLLDLINDVLDLSSVEAGNRAISLDPVPLHAVVEECQRLLQPLARQRQVRFVGADGIDGTLHVQADRRRLKQVLLNLLSNAVKYNRDGGQVVLGCDAEADQVTFRVSDTGPGLTRDQQAQLFRAFERLGAQHGIVQGAGIGLVLSKRLVELMGGSIGVESAVGAGSTFWIRLARVQPAPGSADVAGAAMPTVPADATGAAPRTVLYIEDNPVNVVLVEAMLAHAPGVRMRSALDPAIGLALARAEPPDLVLLDIQLPGIDGYEVLQRLRENASTCKIPVIAISANAMRSDVERGLAAGFDAYLTKPVDMHELLAAVDRLGQR